MAKKGDLSTLTNDKTLDSLIAFKTVDAIKDANEELERLKKTAKEAGYSVSDNLVKAFTDLKKDEIGKMIKEELNKPLEDYQERLDTVGSALNKVSSKMTSVLKGAFSAVKSVITDAIVASKEFYQSLNNIQGINGNVGNLAQAITNAATGSVSRQDIADFLQAADGIFTSATAMQENIPYITDLIGLYGDANTALSKYKSSLLLSTESQKQFAEYSAKANEIIQNTPTAKIQEAQNAFKELITTLGQDLLMVLEPILNIVKQFAAAVRVLRNNSMGQGQSEEEMYAELQKLAEEYGVTLEELNQIERGTFTSSLDEAHDIGQGMVGEGQTPFSAMSTEVDEADEKTKELAKTIQGVLDSIIAIGKSLVDIFAAVAPPVLKIVSSILTIVANMIKWLDSVGALVPILGTIIGLMVAIKAAQIAVTIAKLAGAMVTNPVGAVAGLAILATVGIGAGVVAGISNSGVTAPTSAPQQENRIFKLSLSVDGKKVNDALSTESYYNEEVKL